MKLLPCPLCGNAPVSDSDYNRDVMASAWRVECHRCGLIVEKHKHDGPGDNEAVAVAMWQRLASGPRAPITFYTEAEKANGRLLEEDKGAAR